MEKRIGSSSCFQGSFPQSSQGFQDFLQNINDIPTQTSTIIGMESTSIYHLNLLSFLVEHNISTVIINPSVIKSFSKLNVRDSKSDRKDASIITEYLLYGKPAIFLKNNLPEIKLFPQN